MTSSMSGKERAVIYVESSSDLSKKSKSMPMMSSSSSSAATNMAGGVGGRSKLLGDKNNYVIKIQIGEETMYNPVRIDVTTANKNGGGSIIGGAVNGNNGNSGRGAIVGGGGVIGHLGKSTILGEDSPLNSSGQSSPRSDMTPPPRINSGGAIRFGSETSESDTESDVSAEYINRPLACPTAQFAMREMLEMVANGGGNGHGPISPIHSNASSPTSVKSLSFVSSPRQDIPSKVQFKEIIAHSFATRSHSASSARDDHNHNYHHKHHQSLKNSLSLCPSENGGGSNNNNSNHNSIMMIDHRNGSSNSIESVRMSLLKTHLRMPRFMEEGGSESSSAGHHLKEGHVVDENGFHLDEFNAKSANEASAASESISNFAGYKDIFARAKQEGPSQIMSDKGTIRGVKNRVRDGIATFLQPKDIKTYSDKEQGRVVVYSTSMGVVRATSHRCQKVKQILRTLLVKFDERDCYMNRSIQDEIRQRLPPRVNNQVVTSSTATAAVNNNNNNADPANHCSKNQPKTNDHISLPQVFVEGFHLGDAETIEKLNETGELRDMLKPYKSLSVLSTCDRCGGYRMLPCPVCNGSKKSVHRNHFTTEFVALKCMHCDPSGLVHCDLCNSNDC